MNDTAAFAAIDYDSEICRTVPFYGELYRQIAETAKLFGNAPVSWLDIGCGTGKMLRECGFAESEVFALSCCQSAFISVK